MAAYTVLPYLNTSSFHLPNPYRRTNSHPYGPWKHRTSQPTTRSSCQKMYVPGFGEASPEAKAAKNLHNFFTYIAVRIVAAQPEIPSLSLSLYTQKNTNKRALSLSLCVCSPCLSERVFTLSIPVHQCVCVLCIYTCI